MYINLVKNEMQIVPNLLVETCLHEMPKAKLLLHKSANAKVY